MKQIDLDLITPVNIEQSQEKLPLLADYALDVEAEEEKFVEGDHVTYKGQRGHIIKLLKLTCHLELIPSLEVIKRVPLKDLKLIARQQSLFPVKEVTFSDRVEKLKAKMVREQNLSLTTKPENEALIREQSLSLTDSRDEQSLVREKNLSLTSEGDNGQPVREKNCSLTMGMVVVDTRSKLQRLGIIQGINEDCAPWKFFIKWPDQPDTEPCRIEWLKLYRLQLNDKVTDSTMPVYIEGQIEAVDLNNSPWCFKVCWWDGSPDWVNGDNLKVISELPPMKLKRGSIFTQEDKLGIIEAVDYEGRRYKIAWRTGEIEWWNEEDFVREKELSLTTEHQKQPLVREKNNSLINNSEEQEPIREKNLSLIDQCQHDWEIPYESENFLDKPRKKCCKCGKVDELSPQEDRELVIAYIQNLIAISKILDRELEAAKTSIEINEINSRKNFYRQRLEFLQGLVPDYEDRWSVRENNLSLTGDQPEQNVIREKKQAKKCHHHWRLELKNSRYTGQKICNKCGISESVILSDQQYFQDSIDHDKRQLAYWEKRLNDDSVSPPKEDCQEAIKHFQTSLEEFNKLFPGVYEPVRENNNSLPSQNKPFEDFKQAATNWDEAQIEEAIAYLKSLKQQPQEETEAEEKDISPVRENNSYLNGQTTNSKPLGATVMYVEEKFTTHTKKDGKKTFSGPYYFLRRKKAQPGEKRQIYLGKQIPEEYKDLRLYHARMAA